LQREVAQSLGGVVAEGRDTTTVVFPEASLKFFLWASPAVRARRRAEELEAPERLEEIQTKIEERDRKDSERADSPLREAPDAIRIDTGNLSADEVLETMLDRVRARTHRD
jgi:cytidylate kinase